MGLNTGKLKELQKGLNEKATGGGSNLFLQSNKIGEETNIRLLPPTPRMNEIFFVEQEVWWINGKIYQVNSTPLFKGKDVIKEEIDEAKKLKDADIDALIGAKKDGKPLVKKELRFLVPIILLDVKYDRNDEVESATVVDDMGKILVAKPSLLSEINKQVTARPNQNGTADGIADREKGLNLILSRTGTGLNTTYSAIAWREEMDLTDESLDKIYSEVPDVIKVVEDMHREDDYLRGIIRNYLYGEPMPEEPKKDDKKEEDKALAKNLVGAKKVAVKAKAVEKVEEPKKVEKKAKVTIGGGAKARNVIEDAGADDDNDFSDLDD